MFYVTYSDLDYDDLQVFFLANNVLNTGNANAKVTRVELYASHKILSTFGGATNLWAPPRTYGASFNYYWR